MKTIADAMSAAGRSTTKERSKGRKKYKTSRVAMIEARIPSRHPPIQALRNTAGLNRNHAKGQVTGDIINCTRNVTNTGARARIMRLNLNSTPTPVPFVENDRFPFTISLQHLIYLIDPGELRLLPRRPALLAPYRCECFQSR